MWNKLKLFIFIKVTRTLYILYVAEALSYCDQRALIEAFLTQNNNLQKWA